MQIVRKKKTKKEGRLWQHNLSARSNQDIQRNYEKNAMKEIVAMLNNRTATMTEGFQKTMKYQRNVTPIGNSCSLIGLLPLFHITGGVWLRLESEWKEAHCSSSTQQKPRSIFTGKVRPIAKINKT